MDMERLVTLMQSNFVKMVQQSLGTNGHLMVRHIITQQKIVVFVERQMMVKTIGIVYNMHTAIAVSYFINVTILLNLIYFKSPMRTPLSKMLTYSLTRQTHTFGLELRKSLMVS